MDSEGYVKIVSVWHYLLERDKHEEGSEAADLVQSKLSYSGLTPALIMYAYEQARGKWFDHEGGRY